jgi:hypothetical protein
MRNGTATAVVTFHRNECYRPDLTGEFTQDDNGNLVDPPCPPGRSYRSDEKFMVKSLPQLLSLDYGQETELTFTFLDPIPFDATDVYLQVVYRGTLGEEQERGIAVGSTDISEPTFVAVMNGTDVFAIPDGSSTGRFSYYTDIIANIAQSPYSIIDANRNRRYDSPPDVYVNGGNMHIELFLDGGEFADVQTLPEGRFARTALLLPPGPFNLHLRSHGGGFDGMFASFRYPAKVNQYDWVADTYWVSTVHNLREAQTKQWVSVTYNRYHGSANPPLRMMPRSRDTAATQPVGLRMFPESAQASWTASRTQATGEEVHGTQEEQTPHTGTRGRISPAGVTEPKATTLASQSRTNPKSAMRASTSVPSIFK